MSRQDDVRTLYHGDVTKPRQLNLDDLSARTGLTVKTLSSYEKKGVLPPRDGEYTEKGHVRPVWNESTIVAWELARPGRGWAKGQTRPRAAGSAAA
jgi:hypothetical protein